MIKKFPFYKQEGIKECALASILMILKYYKGNINQIRLSEMLKVSKRGTTAFHIVETLNKLGFHAEGIKTNIKGIPFLPVIAHVVIDEVYKHYIVIYNIDYQRKKILVADPAKGFITYSFNQFEKIWDGIIITMYPVKKIVNESKYSMCKFIKRLLKPYKFSIVKIGILSFFITLESIVISFIFHLIFNPTFNLIILFLFIFISKSILEYIRNNLLLNLTNKIDEKITIHSFKKIIDLPYNYYQNRTSGEIISKITDLKNVKMFISQLIVTLFTDIPLIILSCICLIILSKAIFLTAFILLFFLVIVTIKYHSKLKNQMFLVKENNSDTISFMVESIEAFETIKGLNIENKIINKLREKNDFFLLNSFRLGKLYNRQSLLKNLIISLGNLMIIFMGLYLVKNNYLRFEMFITSILLLSYLIESVKNTLGLNLEFSDFVVSLKRIIDITTYNKNKKNESLNLVVDKVSFSYDDEKNILNDITIDFVNNEKIIIVGKSGSGKSTLLKLLMQYYMPKKGLIMTKINTTYVSQDEKLFTGTLKDNLTFYNDNNLTKIIDICCLSEIIKKDNLKLNQLIEENAFNLSGGEKQRIILARALMKKFDVLLLDEALNSVGVSMERKILKNIFREFPNKTIVFVSHRLDNADIFDRMIKMEQGKIIFDEKKNKGDGK